MICRAMPVEKPVITAFDTKLMTAPSRRTPRSSIAAPTIKVSMATFPASLGSSPTSERTLFEVRAIALVSVVTMRTVREVSEPTIAGTTPAYRPATGLNPAIEAYAIPSGIEKRPVTAPEAASEAFGRPSPASARRARLAAACFTRGRSARHRRIWRRARRGRWS